MYESSVVTSILIIFKGFKGLRGPKGDDGVQGRAGFPGVDVSTYVVSNRKCNINYLYFRVLME